ncbi:chemoreceptor glutamine deamidase CheD [Marinobacterium jannaschii]|uniref:chemoreceptor glutamine deamidase CheD n=1 Tax=Marinobacterium jannaschii TaxID=64970 RepID=UPI00048337CA|nr:chemoreceptor glutamine deamidase CheD [Marinobacterium jannaschii]
MQNTTEQPKPALPGFEHHKRFWISNQKKYAVKVAPGEFYVTRNDEVIVTTLGSCISACIIDEVVGVGGMNHFILPDSGPGHVHDDLAGSSRYGTFAMEELINSILKFGGKRERLRAKITGGGEMLNGTSQIGAKNAHFVVDFLNTERIQIEAEDIGGPWPRKVMYIPREGRMLVKKMERFDRSRIVEEETQYQKQLDKSLDQSDVELF